jgi:hypothetical protein
MTENRAAYEEGARSGRLDRFLEYRSDYAWMGVGDLNQYVHYYSLGYRDGWAGADNRYIPEN